MATLYAVFYLLVAVATGWMIRIHPWPLLGAAGFTQDFWYAVVFKIGLLLLVPLTVYYDSGYRLVDLMPDPEFHPRTIVKLAAGYLLGAAVNFSHLDAIASAASHFPFPDLALRIGASLLLPLAYAGFPEEFFFRGILQTRLERIWGRVPAILVASLLFTAWHLPTRYLLAHGVEGEAGNLVSVLLGTGLPVFVVSLFFAWLWDRNRNLPVLIAIHTGIDTLPALSSFLGISV